MLAGLHCQLLYVTSFVFIGYDLLKPQECMYAVKDHDMFAYVESYPEDFPEKIRKFMVNFLKNSIQCIEFFKMLTLVSLISVVSEFCGTSFHDIWSLY